MTGQDLPEPLVPPDTDIAGLSAFMLDTQRLFASELWALSTGEEFKAAVALWGRSWQQSPPGSLPNDERLLAAFSGAGARWKKVRAMAMRGFVACSDGRLYHRTLCEDVLRAARKKEERRLRTAAATEARKRRNGPDETPPDRPSRSPSEHRDEDRNDQRNDARHVERNDQRDGRHTVNVTSNVTRSHRQDRTGQEERKEESPPPSDPHPASGGGGPRLVKADLDRVEARCREALGEYAPLDPVIGPMAALEREGFDLEAEIVPALLDAASRQRKRIRAWSLFATLTRERIEARRAERVADGRPAAPGPTQPMVSLGSHGSWPERILLEQIAKCQSNPSAWQTSLLGPRPGEPGCKVPTHLLVRAA